MSKSYIISSTVAVRKELYFEECIQKRPIPFLNKRYQSGSFLYWSDKVGSYYPNATQKFMNKRNISFVPKDKPNEIVTK